MIVFANYLLLTCGFLFIILSIHYAYKFTKRKEYRFPLLFAMWIMTFVESLIFFFVAGSLINIKWLDNIESFLILSGLSFYVFLGSFIIYGLKQIGYTIKILYLFLTKKKEKTQKAVSATKQKKALGLFWSKKTERENINE